MNLAYRKAVSSDAELLIDIYNSSFYDDYVQYGECPGYGKTMEEMETSIENYPKHIIIGEMVIVDDCSTDDTRIIVDKYIAKDSRINIIVLKQTPERQLLGIQH